MPVKGGRLTIIVQQGSAWPVRILAFTLGAAVTVAPAVAGAQAGPSDYTYAMRYDLARRVVGTIAPDPDGSGPLRHAAVRNTYDPAGRLTKVEKGQLSEWRPAQEAPLSWGGYFSLQVQVNTTYDTMDRKTLELTSSGGDSVRSITVQLQQSGSA